MERRAEAIEGPIRSNLKTVLAATDFSAAADNALAWAEEIARAHGATLELVHALNLPLVAAETVAPTAEFLSEVEDAAKRRLEETVAQLKGRGCNVHARLTAAGCLRLPRRPAAERPGQGRPPGPGRGAARSGGAPARRGGGAGLGLAPVAAGDGRPVLTNLRRYREAFEYHRQALEVRVRTVGRQHPSVALTLYNLGSALSQQGRYAEALPYFQEARSSRSPSGTVGAGIA